MCWSHALHVERFRSCAVWLVALAVVGCAGPGTAAQVTGRGGVADTVPPARLAVPAGAAIAMLRARTAGRVVRVWVGRDDYFEIRGARFDSSTIGFTGGYFHDATAWSDSEVAPLPASISWDQANRVGVQRSNVRLGAAVGAGLTVYAAVRGANLPDPNWGYLPLASLIPLAAVVGAGAGALLGQAISSWPILWRATPGRH